MSQLQLIAMRRRPWLYIFLLVIIALLGILVLQHSVIYDAVGNCEIGYLT